MNRSEVTAMGRVIVCLLLMIGVAGAQLPDVTKKTATAPDPDLIGKLTKELNVSPKQATGGAGAIFGLAKTQLKPAEFSKLAAAVPGMDGFLKAAPSAKTGSSLGSLESVLPSGSAGGLASLAGSFKSLGLSPDMATKFVPVMQDYLKSKGGSGVASLLSGALK